MISLNEQERMQYLDRVRAMRDEISRKAEWERTAWEAQEKAWQGGMEKGLEKGTDKGNIQGLSKAVVRAMQKKFGSAALPYLSDLNRIEEEGKFLELQDSLFGDITLEEFVAQFRKDS